ncbi:MAG: 3'-5' exonuclease, partial [Planctomycetota bacterium]
HSSQFVFEEWQYAVDQQGLMIWDEYRDVSRVGRGTPLGPAERERVWGMFAPVLSEIEEADSLPWSIVCRKAREAIESGRVERPFDAVVIDEVQDLNVQEVRFLAALAGEGSDNLMLIGDAGQRIYPGGFSLRSMGIEVRGRSRVLKVNYRTTREIASAAGHLRDQTVDDLDGESEVGGGIQTLLSGKAPIMRGFNRYEEENEFVGERIAELISEGTRPSEIGVFARLKRLRYWFEEELKRRKIPVCASDRREDDAKEDGVYMSTMHGAKGMEFRFVFIVGCQQGQVPARAPVGMASDEMERKAALQREKNLLYVSMTRAREQLYVTWTGRPSEFLGDPAE